jgi:transcription antitermination factor NusG
MSKFNPAWYLIYTKPQHENKLAVQLSENDIECLLPKTKVLRQWHDRKKIIDMPLFPSYVFVHLNAMADYYHCMDLDGFCSYVKFGNQLAIIHENTIKDITLIADKGRNIEVANNSLREGQKIVICNGPLCGLSGEVVEYKGKQKICVRVHLLNRIILTDIETSMLSKELA